MQIVTQVGRNIIHHSVFVWLLIIIMSFFFPKLVTLFMFLAELRICSASLLCQVCVKCYNNPVNPLNTELNPICQ